MKAQLARLGIALKTHATVFLIGIACATVAYGFIHLLIYAIRALLRYI
jgi:hypothetical protein